MRLKFSILTLIFLAFCLSGFLPSPARAQTGPGQQLCGATPLPFGSTVNIPASMQNCFQVTLTGNVSTSNLDFPYRGEWIYLTLIQDSVGGRSFTPPYNTLNWQPIDTRPFSDTPGSTAGTTTEEGYFDGTYWQIIGGYSSSTPAGCFNGATNTQYVDSAQGNDTNTGLNWCAAKLTEQAAVTVLSRTGGGWIYVAPKYTGAAATGVPPGIHILRANQYDALHSTAERFSFPDWTDVTEDHHAFDSNSDGTLADAHAAYLAVGPFSLLALTSSVLGNTVIPSGAAQANSEQAGVAGITTNNSNLDLAQSDGVLGICYNNLSLGLDCSGVVAAVGNSAGANSDGSFEAIWANLSLAGTTSDAMGVVIRATGGHMPTAEIGSFSGRPNAAIDVAYGGASGDSFPSGIYFENAVVGTWPIVFDANANAQNPHTDVFSYYKWKDYYGGLAANNTLSAIKINNGALTSQGAYQAGNYVFNNSANSSEVVLPINHTGTVSVDGINSVAFSATPVFDRAQGKIQTITLTASVSSSTLNNCVAGQTILFDVIENGTAGFTFAWPANFHGAGTIVTTASEHNRQAFYCDGTNVWSTSAMQSGT